jgi:hypothetical protein
MVLNRRNDGDPQLLTLLHRLLALPDVAALAEEPPPAQTSAPVLPVHFARSDTSSRASRCTLRRK